MKIRANWKAVKKGCLITVVILWGLLFLFYLFTEAFPHADWKIILIEFIVLIVALFVYGFISLGKYKNILKHYNSKNYDLALNKGLRYLKWNAYGILKEYVYYMIAVIYLHKNNSVEMNNYLSKIRDKSRNVETLSAKYQLLTMESLINNEIANAQNFYKEYIFYINKAVSDSPYKIYQPVLEKVFLYLNEKDETVKNELKNTVQDVKPEVFKNYIMTLIGAEAK